MQYTDFYDIQAKSFEAFCRKVILNESINAHKHANYIAMNEVPFDDISTQIEENLYYEDTYCINVVRVGNLDCAVRISNDYIAQGLKALSPVMRSIVILSYFYDRTDVQIARLLHMKPSTVGYKRRRALALLKDILEEQYYDK